MTYAMPARGTKRTCQACESRFYDLDRTPVLCPKCGVEYVEPVRPPSPYKSRRRGGFGSNVPVQPIEPEDRAPEEERDEEREEEVDGDAEPESESDDEAAVE